MTHPSAAWPRGLLLAFSAVLASCSGDGVEAAHAPPTKKAVAAEPREAGHALIRVERAEGKPPGRWYKLRATEDDDNGAADRAAKPEQLGQRGAFAGLGYSGAYVEGGEFSGAIAHQPEQIEPGLTLFCSGHDTSVLLIDSTGAIVHHWDLDYDELFPERLPFKAMEFHSEFVRRAWAFPNGDLLAIFEYIGIVRVDATGTPIWVRANKSHHDFEVQDDGTIVTLDIVQREREWVIEHYQAHRFQEGLMDSHVLFLDEGGELLRKISILEAIHSSRFAAFLGLIPHKPVDVFHANSVDVLDAATAAGHPLFEAGDILVSLRSPSAVVVIDGETEKAKWIGRGLTYAQHQASFQPSGTILLLDNRGGNQTSPLLTDRSRAIEIIPGSQEIVWRYPALGQDIDFYTSMLGYIERLPGGNTLITESMQGHLIEVNPEGEVVWEYYSPFRAGEDNEFITTLMGARRVPRTALPFLDD